MRNVCVGQSSTGRSPKEPVEKSFRVFGTVE
jgi:hypothetical protein